MEDWKKAVLGSFLITLLFIVGLGAYTRVQLQDLNQALERQQEEVSKQLDVLSAHLTQSEERLKESLNTQITGVRGDLDTAKHGLDVKLQQVGARVEGVKKEAEESRAVLTGQIQSVEQKSQEKMGEIEQQLINVNVKTGSFAGVVSKAIKSVVAINTDAGIGSGVIIDQDGYIVTNRHVIEGATQGSAKTADGAHHQVRIVAKSPTADLALLQIQGTYPPLLFGRSNSVPVGSHVVAIGSPAGLEFTASEGIVSAQRRIGDFDYIQTDLPLNPGNSGGPLINPRGEIVGINTIKLKDFEGLGFALTSEQVSDFALEAVAADKKAREAQQASG